VTAMTSFPPEDPQPIPGADPAEPRKARRGQAVTVAILLLIAIAIAVVLLLLLL
jgi:hypothetical protein